MFEYDFRVTVASLKTPYRTIYYGFLKDKWLCGFSYTGEAILLRAGCRNVRNGHAERPVGGLEGTALAVPPRRPHPISSIG